MMRLVIAISALAALAAVARADIPPKVFDPCPGHHPGDRCNAYFVNDGVCAKYKEWDGRHQGEVEVLRCRPDRKVVAGVALAFGLAAYGAGVLVVRSRRRRA
jgi:hypothetical protein